MEIFGYSLVDSEELRQALYYTKILYGSGGVALGYLIGYLLGRNEKKIKAHQYKKLRKEFEPNSSPKALIDS